MAMIIYYIIYRRGQLGRSIISLATGAWRRSRGQYVL